jgi:hypothetical protein
MVSGGSCDREHDYDEESVEWEDANEDGDDTYEDEKRFHARKRTKGGDSDSESNGDVGNERGGELLAVARSSMPFSMSVDINNLMHAHTNTTPSLSGQAFSSVAMPTHHPDNTGPDTVGATNAQGTPHSSVSGSVNVNVILVDEVRELCKQLRTTHLPMLKVRGDATSRIYDIIYLFIFIKQ